MVATSFNRIHNIVPISGREGEREGREGGRREVGGETEERGKER